MGPERCVLARIGTCACARFVSWSARVRVGRVGAGWAWRSTCAGFWVAGPQLSRQSGALACNTLLLGGAVHSTQPLPPHHHRRNAIHPLCHPRPTPARRATCPPLPSTSWSSTMRPRAKCGRASSSSPAPEHAQLGQLRATPLPDRPRAGLPAGGMPARALGLKCGRACAHAPRLSSREPRARFTAGGVPASAPPPRRLATARAACGGVLLPPV